MRQYKNKLMVEAQIAADLIAYLNSDDEDLNHDMVEGETSFLEAIDAAISEMDDADVTIEGCKAKEAELAGRRKRAEARKEKLRGLIEHAMVMADLPSVKLPTATLSVRKLPPKPLIEDESSIPSAFWKQPDPVLDRKAINEAFKRGDAIDGVGQTNGTISLTIRRS